MLQGLPPNSAPRFNAAGAANGLMLEPFQFPTLQSRDIEMHAVQQRASRNALVVNRSEGGPHCNIIALTLLGRDRRYEALPWIS
jgi:hypothetical protein